MTELPFLVDSGASISLVPAAWYQQIPAEVRPPLMPTNLNVFAGGVNNRIRVLGRTTLDLNLQGHVYKNNFYVSPDEQHGILGMNFMHRWDCHLEPRQRKLVFSNRALKVFDKRGRKLNHRVVMERTVHIRPGERYVVTGVIKGRGPVEENQPILIEAARSLYSKTGVLVARVAVEPKGFHVPVEVQNMTEETQTIFKDQTLGIATTILDARIYEQTPHAKMEEQLMRDQGAFNQDPPAESEAAATDTASDADDTEPTTTPKVSAEAATEPAAAESTEHVDARVEDKREHAPKRFHYVRPPRKPKAEERPEPPWDDVKPFPTYTKCEWNVEDILYEYGEPPADIDVQRLPFHVQELFTRVTATWTNPWEILGFYHLLDSFSEAFAKDKNDLGSCNLVKHHIDTGDERPFKQKLRRFPLAHQEEIERQVKQLAEKKIISPSNSSYGSNVLLVKKKDGTWRMCIDYRQLNRQTKNLDPYPVPRIDATLDALGGAKYFCTLDLIQGYHQVELTESSKTRTAFLTPHMTPCQWQYNYLPYGVLGGPSTFMRVMDRLLHGIAYRIALAYLDDIVVFAPTRLMCMDRLAEVFNRLIDAGLKLKISKCTFFEEETLYLGHVITGEGVKCDPAKIEVIKHWKKPQTPKQVLEFCGFVNYYNRFVKDFSKTARPLYELTHKNAKWEWTEVHDAAFEKLRDQVINAPVMAYPTPDGEWILDTDASGYAIGAVLSQMQKQEDGEEVEKVIAYGSRSLKGAEQRYCTRRRELLAIVNFVKHFRPYVYGRHVLIRTDHASLKYIKTQNDPGDQAARWIQCLEETLYTIEIRQGKKHCNADALSRLPVVECTGKKCICKGVDDLEKTGDAADDYHFEGAKASRDVMYRRVELPNDEFVGSFTVMQQWEADELAEAQREDPDLTLLYEAKRDKREKPHGAEISPLSEAAKSYLHDWRRIEMRPNGVLYRHWENADGTEVRDQILLPLKYQEEMYRQAHEAQTAGHMGRRRTLHKLQQKYFWHHMSDDIQLWVQCCEICQMRKRGCKPAKAPLTTVVSGNPNERIALDIIDHLRATKSGNCCILTITDYFTKYVRAIPLPNQTAKTIADALLKHWISYWGAPHQLHTDQGRAFDGTLMRELCKLLNVEKTRTTPYHPAGDGQVERYNQTLMHALHAQARNDPDNWDKYIDDAVIAYNSTKHSVTGFEPNRLMVGRNISLPEDLQVPHDPLIQPQYTTKYVRNTAKEMRFCYALVRERLKRAATAMKRYYDRGAKLYHYKEGDAVRVRRFRLNKGTKKFEDFYEGPFYVIDVLGDVTFRVAEGPRSKRRVLHHDSLLPYFNRDPENVVIDNAWVFGVSTTYKPAGDCDAAVQTDAWQPLPAELEQDKNDDDVPELVEESDEEAELPAVVLDTARTAPSADPATDDEAPCRYVLRSRKVPQAYSPPGQRSTAPGTPRRRGRPPKVPPDKRSDMGVQTQVQIDVRLV